MIFLLVGTTSFPDPGNWNPVNKVECIGTGGAGGYGRVDYNAGGGGSGASYAYANNMVLTFPVPCAFGYNYGYNGATNFNTDITGPLTSGNIVSAQNGEAAPGYNPGRAPVTAYPAGFVGGAGGYANGETYSGDCGGGGGGAGGPHGAGGAGANATTGTNFGAGGAADGGTTPGQPADHAIGVSGTQWDASHGCGGGGSGSSVAQVAGGRGGLYGGGGGGSPDKGSQNTSGGPGENGLIVLTYVPFVAATQTNAIMMGV